MDPLEHLNSLGQFRIDPGLERIRHVMGSLGDPHLEFPTVHIGGTNGKGSTAAILDTILREFDLYTGLFTSPHLISPTERFSFGGKEIGIGELGDAIGKVLNDPRAGESAGELTYFELLTASYFLLCRERGPDVSITEVGMGGKWDATNVIEPHAVCITNISLDHTKHLGDDMASIAREKAGIIKPSTPVVIGPMTGDEREALRALRILLESCSGNGCPVICITTPEMADGTISLCRSHELYDHLVMEVQQGNGIGNCFSINSLERSTDRSEPCFDLIPPILKGDHDVSLIGIHQSWNATCAMTLAAIVLPTAFAKKKIQKGDMSASMGLLNICPEDLTDRMGVDEVRKRTADGNKKVRLHGRMEKIVVNDREVIFDGGHNPGASRVLMRTIEKEHPGARIHLLIGMMSDKDIRDFASRVVPGSHTVTLVDIPLERAMDIMGLLKGTALYSDAGKDIYTFHDINEGIRQWTSLQDSEMDLGICCGSFYLYQFLAGYGKDPNKNYNG